MVLPLRSAGFSMPGIRTHHELHESLAAEHRDHLHRHAVLPDDDGCVGDDAADRHIAGADLLGDIDAAAADREAHIEAGLREIAFALGKLDRPERRQQRRGREQIGDLLIGRAPAAALKTPNTERNARYALQ